ncbi:hypothetical protein MTR_7g081015 [Medicago truncatula]|uniref:Uncharacterized protein n=1 Tax=Medicago truncatula TaxID=3880 RepID=A0A072U117_MEDTR|nr:hypothetical protein MTR_7g081015 [Medicago truncatula]
MTKCIFQIKEKFKRELLDFQRIGQTKLFPHDIVLIMGGLKNEEKARKKNLFLCYKLKETKSIKEPTMATVIMGKKCVEIPTRGVCGVFYSSEYYNVSCSRTEEAKKGAL